MTCSRCGGKGYVEVDRSEAFIEHVPCCPVLRQQRDELAEIVANNRATNQLVFGFLRKLRAKLGMEPPSAILDMGEESEVMLGMVQAEIDGRAGAEAALAKMEGKR